MLVQSRSVSSKVGKRYILVPIVYIGVIVLLVYMQFSQSESVTRTVGEIAVTSSEPRWKVNGPGTLSIAEVTVGPLQFPFTEATPLALADRYGSTKVLQVRGVREQEDGVEVEFTDGVTLTFRDSRDGMYIVPEVPTRFASYRFLVLPYRTDGAASGADALPVLVADAEPAPAMLALPRGSRVVAAKRQLQVSVASGVEPMVFRFAVNESPSVFWFANMTGLADGGAYAQAVPEFVDAAYEGWRRGRFSRSAITWRTGDAGRSFQEGILVSLLAESLRRDEYAEVYALVRGAARLHGASLTYRSNPFFGNLVETNRERRKEASEDRARIEEQIRSGNAAVFTYPDLIQTIVDWGDTTLLAQLYALAKSVAPAEQPLDVLLGMIATYVEERSLNPNAPSSLQAFASLAEDLLLPMIRSTDRGLFAQRQESEASVYDTIRAGRLLISVAEVQEHPGIAAIGRTLVVSALNLADQESFLPELLTTEEGAVVASNGTLPPERVYPLLVDTVHYPHAVPLSDRLSPGAWIWTVADLPAVSLSPGEYRIRMRFPAGQIHHITLHGIPPFSRMEMFDLRWPSDPQFERYTSGWAYDGETETLYMKIRHKEDVEEIVIRF